MTKILNLSLILLSQTIAAQPAFKQVIPGTTFDIILNKSIMTPDLVYRDAGVKTVKRELSDFHTKQSFRKLSEYNNSGFLTNETNWDSASIVGGEIITVKYLNSGIREVTRKISRTDFLKIKQMKLRSDQFLTAYPYSGYEGNDVSSADTLIFMDSMHWLKDSSVFYEHFVNGTFNDSGITQTTQTHFEEDVWNCETTEKIYSKSLKDSIVHCVVYRQPGYFSFDTFRVKNGLISEVRHSANNLHFPRTELLTYDSKGNLKEIVFMSKGVLYARHVYTYSENREPVIIRENYERGILMSKVTSDLNGKILVKIYPAIKNVRTEGKEIYIYNEKGLIAKQENWWGDYLERMITYTYSYFE